MRERKALGAAVVLVILGVAGSPFLDAAQLLLLPAAVAFAVGVHALRRRHQSALGRLGQGASLLLEGSATALAVLAIVGLVLQSAIAVEPSWLGRSVEIVGITFLIGGVGFALAALLTGALPRRPALLAAASLPLGLGIDAGLRWLSRALFYGTDLFLYGSGIYLGITLFALGYYWFASWRAKTGTGRSEAGQLPRLLRQCL